MPIDRPIITLILPGLQTFANVLRLPALEMFIARGSGLQSYEPDPRGPLERWQAQLLGALTLPRDQFPSAAVTCLGFGLGSGGEMHSGTWLQVAPMHMSVALNGLSLHSAPLWSAVELDAIEASVAKHCCEVGFEWRRIGDKVFLQHAVPLQVETVAAELAYRFPLRSVQPLGPDARKINQLSTELQMLLHEHPVLERGSSAPINALWLWGNGSLPAVQSPSAQIMSLPSTPLPRAWSDEPYVRGLYQLCGANCNELTTFDQIDAEGKYALVVARTSDMSVAESRWFAPLLDGLQRGRWHEARVYFDDWQFTIRRHQLWRVWRRSQSIATSLQAAQLHTA